MVDRLLLIMSAKFLRKTNWILKRIKKYEVLQFLYKIECKYVIPRKKELTWYEIELKQNKLTISKGELSLQCHLEPDNDPWGNKTYSQRSSIVCETWWSEKNVSLKYYETRYR